MMSDRAIPRRVVSGSVHPRRDARFRRMAIGTSCTSVNWQFLRKFYTSSPLMHDAHTCPASRYVHGATMLMMLAQCVRERLDNSPSA